MQPLTRQDGTLITENKGIAEKLNRFFARVYTDKNTKKHMDKAVKDRRRVDHSYHHNRIS